MSLDRDRRRFTCPGIVLAFMLLISPARAGDAERLLLDVIVNGYDVGKIGEFMEMGSVLFAKPGELQALGLIVSQRRPDSLVSLNDLQGVTYRIDMSTQHVMIKVPDSELAPALLSGLAPASGASPVQSGTGATLNYSLVGTQTRRQNALSGLFQVRIFSPSGLMTNSELAEIGGTSQATRLDTAYINADVGPLRRITVGDFINGGLNWTRPVRVGGIQIDTDFGLRPDLVTFPVPQVSGQVAVPSTVNVMVNGIEAFRHDVMPGPFQIASLPVVSGAGTVSVAIQNALGQQTVQTLPFYASSELLRPGLGAYSAELGVVRLNYGVQSDDYGDPAASASYRRGMSPWLTLEGHAEATNTLLMAGAGAAIDVLDEGVLSVSASASTAEGHDGWKVGIGFQRIAPILSFSASSLVASQDFEDIAASEGQPVPTLVTNASLGVTLGALGSFGLTYTELKQLASSPGRSFYTSNDLYTDPFATGNPSYIQATPDHLQLISLSYTAALAPSLLTYATAFTDLAQREDAGLLISLSIPLENRGAASVSGTSAGQQNFGTVQYERNVSQVGDIGGQLLLTAGDPSRAFAELEYESPYALFTAGADHEEGQTVTRATAQGSLSLLDGGLFPSDTIGDSFAIVDTGEPNVHVLEENRPYGETDSAGRLLVTGLRSYNQNRISIDPRDVTADENVDTTSQLVNPAYQAGVVVRFRIKRSEGALLRIVSADDRPVPLGSTITLTGTKTPNPVGYDGEAYVQNLGRRNRATVIEPDGSRCVLTFQFRPEPRVLPTIGPVTCVAAGGPAP